MSKFEKPEIRMTVNDDLAEGIYMASGITISSPFFVNQGLSNESSTQSGETSNHALGCIYGTPIYPSSQYPTPNPRDDGTGEGHTSGNAKRLIFHGEAEYDGPPMPYVRLEVTLHFEQPLPVDHFVGLIDGGNFGGLTLETNGTHFFSDGNKSLTVYYDGEFDNPHEDLGFTSFAIEFDSFAPVNGCYNTTAVDPTIHIVN